MAKSALIAGKPMDIDPSHLPLVKEFQARHRAGLMTLVFTDLAGSTKLKNDLGDALAGAILSKHHSCLRELLRNYPEAREVSTAGDSFFIIFDSPSNAVLFSVQLHKRLRALSKEVGHAIRDRIGIHVGEVFVEHGAVEGKVQNYSGIQVDTCARVMSLCDPERILMTRFAFDNAQQTLKGRADGSGRLLWISHGLFEVKGVAQPLEICEVAEPGKAQPKPLEDSEKAKRFLSAGTALGPESALEKIEGWKGVVARRRREVALSCGAALIALLVVVAAPAFLSVFDAVSFDFAFRLKNPVEPPEAALLYMDQESHDNLGQPDTAPWMHEVHARLVERLTRAGAKAVVFDVLFTSNQPTTPALAKAIAANGRVFLPTLEKGPKEETRLIMPIDELAKVARNGVVESFEKDVTVRKQLGVRGDVKMPTLAELVAEQMAPGSVLRAKGRWLNFYGKTGTLRHYSYFQALTNDLPDSVFQGKAVFIGAVPLEAFTGGRGTNEYVRAYDVFPTPYGKMPGVEVNATAALNLMRGETLAKMSGYLEFAIFLGSAVVLAIVFSFLPTRSMVIGGAVVAFALPFAAGYAVWETHQWFSWAVISLVEIPVIILCCVATRTDKLSRQKRELEKTLAAQQSEFLTKASMLQTQASGGAVVAAGNKPSIPDHELFAPIGKGAYGEVWLGIDLTNSFRAIKIVRARNFKSERPFEREFDGIKKFAPISRAHPGLVDILHVGKNDEDGWFFYIMEAADDIVSRRQIDPGRYRAKTLAALLEGNRALAPDEFLTMAVHLCDGLAFLHSKGLLHRDLKPANVLYMHGKPQLADPGLVAGADTDDSEITMLGTFGYMAPDKTASPASDIYSLGKILYQAAFGRPVTAFPELPTFLLNSENHEFFTGLNDIILKACAQNPRERHASVAELRLELESLGETARIFKPS